MSVSNAQQFCTFYVDRQFFGVPVQQVQEVIRYQEMTRVPLVPRVIRGLINFRGQIVVAIDLRRLWSLRGRLGMTGRQARRHCGRKHQAAPTELSCCHHPVVTMPPSPRRVRQRRLARSPPRRRR